MLKHVLTTSFLLIVYFCMLIGFHRLGLNEETNILISSFGGVSKSMLALNKSVIKVKESQIKGFKMIFELFRKVATSPKSTPDSMTNSTIVTFNTDGKKLTDHLLATLKCCNKTIPMITRNSSILNPKLFKSSFKTLNRC